MNTLLKKSILFACISTLIGCSKSHLSNYKRLCADDLGEFYECNDIEIGAQDPVESIPTLYSPPIQFHLLSEYTEQMASDFEKDLDGITLTTPIVATSFVFFNSSLKDTNSLGNQLKEAFITELQEIGLPVSDHLITQNIVVESEGDFALSKDIREIDTSFRVGYVLVGTLTQNKRGIVINARIVNFANKKVYASSSKFLPNTVLSRLL